DVPITDVATLVTQAQQQQDSLAILQQQEQFPNQIEEFKPITLVMRHSPPFLVVFAYHFGSFEPRFLPLLLPDKFHLPYSGQQA
ncbi:hypothetical protein IAF53_20405, partial [Acinetobacter baumannii]|nr:hypothetical protein [Acinetobacter baumannii]